MSESSGITGSPPLTRGIQWHLTKRNTYKRFTPAHAGNTLYVRYIALSIKVHPRSRGEYCSKRPRKWLSQGSPPLTRGIPLIHHHILCITRFTPAHAGNTWKNRSRARATEVHPRSRGEYTPAPNSLVKVSGSPPLTRGILLLSIIKHFVIRFTPAHAGNTPKLPKRLFGLKVHPRSRGEYNPYSVQKAP